jgi:hypothetical protein
MGMDKCGTILLETSATIINVPIRLPSGKHTTQSLRTFDLFRVKCGRSSSSSLGLIAEDVDPLMLQDDDGEKFEECSAAGYLCQQHKHQWCQYNEHGRG